MSDNGAAALKQIKIMTGRLSTAERQELLSHLNRQMGFEAEEQIKERNRRTIDRLLEVVKSPPHIDNETVDELMRIIKEGKRPAEPGGVFDDLIDPAR